MTLTELQARVAVAIGADSQLDHDIMNACGFACRQDFLNDCGNWFWFAPNGERFEHAGSTLRLTSSIDAALALTERLLPGWTDSSDASAPWAGIDWWLHGPNGEKFHGGSYHSKPLAILSAILSALAAKEAESLRLARAI